LFFSFLIIININIKIKKDNKRLIAASDNPKILNSTFLQLFTSELNNFNNSFLSIIFNEFPVHQENSLKISCSIPK
tara:strand:+ start:218 stop:445 length:228 start_codon:yes stop_codon:yes gene_type:complete